MSARDRPDFLSPYHASAFADADVVRAYRYRAPYPPETFAILRELVVEPRTILDVGCGDGGLARAIASFAERVDALDPSAEMLAAGRRLAPDDPRICWILGRAEDAPLVGPYGLIVAGASVHWLDWEIALPRFASLLAPEGRFAMVHATSKGAWWEDFVALVTEYSLFTDYRDIDMVAELGERGLFALEGRRRTEPVELMQPVDEFVAGLFSHAGLTRARLGAERANAFEDAIRAALLRMTIDPVPLTVTVDIAWGRPLAAHAAR